MIQFEHVSKTFKNNKVLKDLTFTIEDQELVVLIGPSGCGKTTTLRLINQLIKPTNGKILINGEPVDSKNVIELRRNMGYVVQNIGLFPHMTIRDNIEIIEKIQKRDPKTVANRTMELMDMVGLNPDKYLDLYPSQLSGGQQQRVGVARAFATDPDIILMDEPFSALDPITKNTLQDELVSLQSKMQKTICFVTHDMTEAIKLADRICLMNKGEIVQYDVPEMILKHPANDFVSEFVGKNRIWSSPEYIKAKDIMLEYPITSPPNLTILKGIEKMRSCHVDSLLITSPGQKLLGVVSGDQLAKCKNNKQPLESVMELEGVLTVTPEDNIVDILNRATEANVYSIPVVDGQGYLHGLITKSRLVTTLSQQYLDTEDEEVQL